MTFTDLCAAATLQIDSTIIAGTINYNVYDAADTQVLLLNKVTSSPPTTNCPAIDLDFTNSDGTPLDSAVFSVDPSSAPTSYEFKTESSNETKIGNFDITISAKYSGYTSSAPL